MVIIIWDAKGVIKDIEQITLLICRIEGNISRKAFMCQIC